MKRFLALVCACALTLSLTACAKKEENVAASAPAGESKEKITFVLDWTPNTNHTGVFVAMANGYFDEAGIDVEVVQPPDSGAEVLVASNKAQFGVSFQDSMAPALIGDSALPITAVAALIQHNPSGIVSRAGEGMDKPSGMEGKKYATWDMEVEKATLQQVVEADGGDFSKVELIPSTVTDEVSALESKAVDAIWIFYGWAGIACEVAGLDIDYFAFADIDPVFDYYTPVIIASNEYLESQPETAKAFLAALAKGYEFAVEHPEEAAAILMDYAPELKSNEALVVESQKYLAEQYIADASRWGEFDAARWDGFYAWLSDKGLVEEPIPAGTGFTNEYLPG